MKKPFSYFTLILKHFIFSLHACYKIGDVDTVGNIDKRQYENDKNTLDERSELNILSHSEDEISKDISKGVLRKKLSKMRHLVIPKAISYQYLDTLFPQILKLFEPQKVMVSIITEYSIILDIKKSNAECIITIILLMND